MSQNVECKVDKNKLTITIDLKQEHGESKSGKSITIGSTHGNIPIGDGVVLSVNCYKRNPGFKKS